jgi:hypothetical protein
MFLLKPQGFRKIFSLFSIDRDCLRNELISQLLSPVTIMVPIFI